MILSSVLIPDKGKKEAKNDCFVVMCLEAARSYASISNNYCTVVKGSKKGKCLFERSNQKGWSIVDSTHLHSLLQI